MSLYQSSKYRPILTIFVRSMAIGGAVYVYVGDMGGSERKGGVEREEETPGGVLLSDIGFCTNYNARVAFSNKIQFYGLHLTPS